VASSPYFSLPEYQALLQAILARGYRVRDFLDADASQPHLILRHDIDVWPAYALPMAEAEAALGVSASYFVLVSSPLYNAATADCRALLRRLIELGHRVELHFDAAGHDDPQQRDAAAEAECTWLAALTGQQVRMISFHRPAADLLGNAANLAGRPHAYQPRFFREMGYCSDSRGGWLSGAPLDHAALASGRALQLLTHPLWWIGEESARACLDRYLRERVLALDTDLAANVTVHRPGRMLLAEKGKM